jgi:hypothetical protein
MKPISKGQRRRAVLNPWLTKTGVVLTSKAKLD